MKNQIPIPDISPRRYAIEARDATVRDFDEKNKTQLDVTLAELNKILAVKLIVVAKGCDLAAGARYDAFALTKSALDVIVSALHMARQRATVEMFALLRVALESGSTALHITNNTDAYKKYKSGEYKSTRAISYANKAIPILAELWGLFSNSSVHITQLSFGPRLKEEDGRLTPSVVLECDVRKHKPIQDELLLCFISLVSAIVLKITQLTLFQQSPLHEDWLRLAGTHIEHFCNTDERISQYCQKLQNRTAEFAGASGLCLDKEE